MPARRNATTGRTLHGGADLLSPSVQQIAINAIELDEGVIADDLPANFIDSIRHYGIMQPIAVMRYPDSDTARGYLYRIIAGRRRVAAAAYLGMMFVPALVYPHDTPDTIVAAMMLTENYQRRENPLVDLRAIRTLVSAGVSEVEIARHLGLSISQVRSRRALANLIPTMRRALQAGHLSVRLANEVARMPASSQRALRRIWGRAGVDIEITREMVEAAVGQHESESAEDTTVEITHPLRPERTWISTGASPSPRPVEHFLMSNIPRTDAVDNQFSGFRVIDENMIEVGGQQYIRFEQHQHIVQRLESRPPTRVIIPEGVEPVVGTQMIRFNGTAYMTLEEHNRLVTEAVRRRRPVASAAGRVISEAELLAARQEAFESGRASARAEPRIDVPAGLSREQIVERMASSRSRENAITLIEAAARAMPAAPNRQSDDVAEALGLVRDMLLVTA